MEQINLDIDYSSFIPNISLTSDVITNDSNVDIENSGDDNSIDSFFARYNSLTVNIFNDIKDITTFMSVVSNEYAIRNINLPIISMCEHAMAIYKNMLDKIYATKPKVDSNTVKLEIDTSIQNFIYKFTEMVRQLLNDIELFFKEVMNKYGSLVLEQYLYDKYNSMIVFNTELLSHLINCNNSILVDDNGNVIIDTLGLENYLSTYFYNIKCSHE